MLSSQPALLVPSVATSQLFQHAVSNERTPTHPLWTVCGIGGGGGGVCGVHIRCWGDVQCWQGTLPFLDVLLLVLGVIACAASLRWYLGCASLMLRILASAPHSFTYRLAPVYIFSFPRLRNISKGARITFSIYFKNFAE